MKTIKKYMVSLLILAGLLVVSAYSNSQDISTGNKSRKEAKKAEMETRFQVLDSLLSSRKYVLEADYLQNKYGFRRLVTSNLNFIKVDTPNGVLQTGSDFREGHNGVGGITAEGTISNYKISRDPKNMTYTVTFNILTNIGPFDIFLIVTADNYATATITGTTSGQLTWDGHLNAIDNSNIFKGQDTIRG